MEIDKEENNGFYDPSWKNSEILSNPLLYRGCEKQMQLVIIEKSVTLTEQVALNSMMEGEV